MKAEWTNSDLLTTSQTTKAILVIDMPKACADGCPVMCRARGINHRPTWCPLKPMPEKNFDCEPILAVGDTYEDGYRHGEEHGYISGWNACIDEILGETE